MEKTTRPPKINDTVVRLHVRRVALVAALTLMAQTINLMDGAALQNRAEFACLMLLTLLSLGFVATVVCAQMRKKAFGRGMQALCRLYIVAVATCMLPFLLADARMGVFTNVALLAGVLLYAPAFSVQQDWPFFIAGFLYAPLVALLSGTGFWYILRVVGISGAGVMLSYSLHSGYLDVIQSLRVESDQDDLTKLNNRKAGLNRMAALLALCKRMGRTAAAYYIDIDYFKSYNDTYGHLAGDHALIDVAACIRRCFARETDILCRMGGEEFAVLIPVVKRDAALLMAQRLIRMISDMNIQAGSDATYFVVTVSIGVAVYDEDSSLQTTVQMLVDEADRQLYVAKHGGRNCIAMGDAVVYKNEWV